MFIMASNEYEYAVGVFLHRHSAIVKGFHVNYLAGKGVLRPREVCMYTIYVYYNTRGRVYCDLGFLAG